jgi:transcriptional regulator with XRE-family HTH domain
MTKPRTEEITVRFGGKVREERRKRRLSQEKLAELCGLDRTYISGVERGERNVSLRNIVRIARALGVAPSELFSGFDGILVR